MWLCWQYWQCFHHSWWSIKVYGRIWLFDCGKKPMVFLMLGFRPTVTSPLSSCLYFCPHSQWWSCSPRFARNLWLLSFPPLLPCQWRTLPWFRFTGHRVGPLWWNCAWSRSPSWSWDCSVVSDVCCWCRCSTQSPQWCFWSMIWSCLRSGCWLGEITSLT